MAVLDAFGSPGGVDDPAPSAWSERVSRLFAPYAARFAQFYDPTAEDTPEDARIVPVVWPALSGRLTGPPASRWEAADSSRELQDEYCEWGVERNAEGKVARVTFTCEVPEYWEHVFHNDRDALVALYRDFVSADVELEQLSANGGYRRENERNGLTARRPAHLIQRSNTLGAAVDLAANATVLRERDGRPVTNKQALVECGRLGESLRNSDPLIAVTVNNAASSGAEITLSDPPGLYIDGLITGNMATPDGSDPGAFWTTERGEPGRVVRAAYEVPEDRGYAVGDVTIDGRPIRFGGQLAERVRVRLDAVVKPAAHRPSPRPCVG